MHQKGSPESSMTTAASRMLGRSVGAGWYFIYVTYRFHWNQVYYCRQLFWTHRILLANGWMVR